MSRTRITTNGTSGIASTNTTQTITNKTISAASNTLTGVQPALVSGTNIKTVNSTSLLGSGDIPVQSTLVSGTNIKTVNSTSLLGSGDIPVQVPLVQGTNIKTVNSTSLLGSGDIALQSPIGTISGLAKGNGANALTSAVAGTDFVAPTGIDGAIARHMLKDTGFVYFNSSTTNTLDFTNGSHQRWSPNVGAQTLSITNWPPTGNLGELLIEGVNLGAATITWPTINWIKSDGTTTTTFSSNGVTLQTSGTDWVLLWTRDAGTTIFGKVVR